MYCENCGASLSKKAKFCQECGVQITLISGLTSANSQFDDAVIQGVKSLMQLLKKFNKDIDPRDHNDLLVMVVDLQVMERMNEIVEAIEVLKPIQDDDDAITSLLAAFPDLDRDFRIYNQTVKVVLSYLADRNGDD